MNNKNKIAVATVTALLLLSTGCSTNLPSQSELVTDYEFNKALKRTKGTNDDYDGSMTLNGRGDSVVHFADGFGYIGMYAILGNDGESSEWTFDLVGHLYNNEWLFMDSIGIKSTTGRFVAYFSNPKRDVHDYGFISEAGDASLDNSGKEEFCAVMRGKNVTFKLSGQQGFIERKMTKTMIYDSIAVCTVASGLAQGREITIG